MCIRDSAHSHTLIHTHSLTHSGTHTHTPHAHAYPNRAKSVLLSINRYERKKNIGLAIEALARAKQRVSSAEWDAVHLIVAGMGCGRHFSLILAPTYSLCV